MTRRYMAVGLAIPAEPAEPLGSDFRVIDLGRGIEIQGRIPIGYAETFLRARRGARLRVSLDRKPIAIWRRRSGAAGIKREPVIMRVVGVVRTPAKETTT